MCVFGAFDGARNGTGDDGGGDDGDGDVDTDGVNENNRKKK